MVYASPEDPWGGFADRARRHHLVTYFFRRCDAWDRWCRAVARINPAGFNEATLQAAHSAELPGAPDLSAYPADISFLRLLKEVDRGRVRDVLFQGPEMHGTFTDGRSFQTYAPNDPGLVGRLFSRGARSARSRRRMNQPWGRCWQRQSWSLAGSVDGLQAADARHRRHPRKWRVNETISEETRRMIDAEIHGLIETAYAEARQILTDKRDDLEILAKGLFRYETLSGEEISDCSPVELGRAPNPHRLARLRGRMAKSMQAWTQPRLCNPHSGTLSHQTDRPAASPDLCRGRHHSRNISARGF